MFLPGGKEWPGCDADPSPPTSAIGHERVELYLYSPYGPYGLYTASVPVQVLDVDRSGVVCFCLLALAAARDGVYLGLRR